nr:hypothetical protein GCM10020093_039970 [Planobispora longispora]
MDWNSLLSDDPDLLSTRYSDRYFPDADDMVRYLGDFAAACGLRVLYGTRVRHVARVPGEDLFQVTDERGRTREARRVIVATGVGGPTSRRSRASRRPSRTAPPPPTRSGRGPLPLCGRAAFRPVSPCSSPWKRPVRPGRRDFP